MLGLACETSMYSARCGMSCRVSCSCQCLVATSWIFSSSKRVSGGDSEMNPRVGETACKTFIKVRASFPVSQTPISGYCMLGMTRTVTRRHTVPSAADTIPMRPDPGSPERSCQCARLGCQVNFNFFNNLPDRARRSC